MPLTATTVRNAKPKERQYKLTDEKGMYLLVTPKGGKWWRWDYRFSGKRKTLSMGIYPDISLKKAREKRDDARKTLASGIDPSELKKQVKQAQRNSPANSLEAIAAEWITKFSPKWSEKHKQKITRRFERDIFPWIGKKDIATITAPELLAVIRRIENRGAIETAHRALQNCGQVFRYAVAAGRAINDPSTALKGAIQPVNQKHHPSITKPEQIGALLQAIDGYQGSFVTRCALQLAPLIFVRPGELRHAQWNEIDTDKAEWRIPPEKMKMGIQHIVPLSTQALAILEQLHPLTGDGMYIFPSERTSSRAMSENTLNAALRRMGYSKDEMTGHGFRSMASTLLNEQGWNRDAIERQLAHGEKNDIRAAYNFAEYLPERTRMMQHWADYLDGLKTASSVVVGIFGKKA